VADHDAFAGTPGENQHLTPLIGDTPLTGAGDTLELSAPL
jgi:hypothetical protein